MGVLSYMSDLGNTRDNVDPRLQKISLLVIYTSCESSNMYILPWISVDIDIGSLLLFFACYT